MSTNTKEKEKLAKKEIKIEEDFLSNEVANYDFADYVRLRSTPRGVIFSFAKLQPEQKKYTHFKQILLPFDVADILSQVIRDHLDDLTEKGLLKTVKSKEGK